MPPIITSHMDEIRAICQRYGVETLYVFGSAANGTFDPATSDLDFMVDLGAYGNDVAARYFDLYEALQTLFEREIDLITVRSRGDSNFLAEVEATRSEIYAA